MNQEILNSFTKNSDYQKRLNTPDKYRKIDRELFLSWFGHHAKEHMLEQSKITGNVIKYMNLENKKILLTLFGYFCGDENFNKHGIVKGKASLEKGLYIYGSVGTGKTTFFELLKKTGKSLHEKGFQTDLTFRNISCGNFVQQFMSMQKHQMQFDINAYYKNRLYIDDLGVEQLCFNSYELIGDILFERYRNSARTWITTNLNFNQFAERYGKRLEDRFQKMFNVIEWKGKSFRDDM